MLRRLGIRGKVLAALAVPVLVLFAAATLISWQSIESARVARSVSELVGTADELSGFARAMQTERLVSLQAESSSQATRLISAREGTDSAAALLTAVVDAVDIAPLGAAVRESVAQTTSARSTLPALRADIDAGLVGQTVVDSRYTSLIQQHVGQAEEFADALTDRELASYLSAYGLIGEAEEQMVHELPVAMRVVRAGGQDFSATLALAPTVTLDTAAHTEARKAVNRLHLAGVQLKTFDSEYFAQRQQLSSGSTEAIATISPAAYEKSSVDVLVEIARVSDDVTGLGAAMATSKEAAAVQQATTTIAATIVAALLSVLIALLVAHQIIGPLRRLTKAAGDLRAQLPTLVEQVSVPGDAPELSLVYIPVNSRDEVGRLATAFNEVNATTIHVAQEQAALRGSIAEMFVNVARRDQVLLNRQISFIDALERSEEDPSALANLFRLDHLATRMRRNAESLLVLAGIDSGRRIRSSMPLSDVIRTASSEIEQYDRIQLELGADPEMFGFNSLAAAHLLAELMENATVFSEPETRVEVETSSDGDYMQVVVRDFGLGMSDAELESATEKIRSTTAGDVLGAQRLGFYVVGRLAARLAAVVTLARNPGGTGTVAVVRFPASLFEASDQPMESPDGVGSELLYTDALDASEAFGETPAEADGADERADERADQAGGVVPDEAPAGVPIDLEALTDGETSLGLPRRRARDGGATPSESDEALLAESDPTALTETDTAPFDVPDTDVPNTDVPDTDVPDTDVPDTDVPDTDAPGEADVALEEPVEVEVALEEHEGALANDESSIVLPALEDAAISPELAAELAAERTAAGDWTPDVLASDSAPGLPSRMITTNADSADPYSDEPDESDPAALDSVVLDATLTDATSAALPQTGTRLSPTRTGLFAGFRGRVVDAPPVTDLPPLDVRTIAGAHADVERLPDAESDLVIPGFMPDDVPASATLAAAAADEPADVAVQDEVDALTEPAAPPVAAVPEPQYPGFTAFSGYAGYASAAVEPLAFEPTLNEARAWGAGAPEQPKPASSWLPAPEVDHTPKQQAPESAPPVDGLDWIGADAAPWSQPDAEPWAPVELTVAAPALEEPADAAAAQVDATPADEPEAVRPARRGMFSRWRHKEVAEQAAPIVAEEVAPAAAEVSVPELAPAAEEPVAPVRASAWHTGSGAHAAVSPADSRSSAATPAAPRWTPARDVVEPQASAPAPFTPSTFTPSTFTPAAPAESWSARSWSTGRTGAGAADEADRALLPSPSLPLVESPRAAPGALDDEVAAMLAMRSDIQEQALAELGQLSAYRPSTVGTSGGGGHSLQRRVPTAMPAISDPVPDAARRVVRDADQLRARLSSFQSGTTRGRRDAEGPAGATPADPSSDDTTTDHTTDHTPASTW